MDKLKCSTKQGGDRGGTTPGRVGLGAGVLNKLTRFVSSRFWGGGSRLISLPRLCFRARDQSYNLMYLADDDVEIGSDEPGWVSFDVSRHLC